jgi:hypothetical protein
MMPTAPGPPRLLEIRWSDSPKWAASLLDTAARSRADHSTLWVSSGLSALSESIDTRFGVLDYLTGTISALLSDIEALQNRYEAGEGGVTWPDASRVRALLTSATSFLSEARSCFYNLAQFYRLSRRHYHGETSRTKESYDFIAALAGNAEDMNTLKTLRDLVQHYCAPVLTFRNENPSAAIQRLTPALLVTTWDRDTDTRLGTETVTFGELLSLGKRLKTAAAGLVNDLIHRLQQEPGA